MIPKILSKSKSLSPLTMVVFGVMAAVVGVTVFLHSSAETIFGQVTDYTDPNYNTQVPWGSRSHWVQPWRSYLETVPATRLTNSVGINMNVPAQQADSVSKLLHNNGFQHGRLEIGWGNIQSGTNSSAFIPGDQATLAADLTAMKNNGIRPLILLNANDGDPVPATNFQGTITANVSVGATTIQVDAATASKIVPGRSGGDLVAATGLSVLLHNGLLFTAVNGATVTLSQPTQYAITSGTYTMHTFDYAPFQKPFLADGSHNPAFDSTMNGWLNYTDATLNLVKTYFGQNFDVEIWNEMNFGSRFLDASNYYTTPPNNNGSGDVPTELLNRTIDHIRQGTLAPTVGIGDGFANQSPWEASSNEPAGLTAIDKHYYPSFKDFPANAGYDNHIPIDALGQISCTYFTFPCNSTNTKTNGPFKDQFVPTYHEEFPEYWLNRIQTEDIIRDIGPGTYNIGSTVHGRNRPDGSYMPVWQTEFNQVLSTTTANYYGDLKHYQAKALSRYLASYVNKGLDRVYFYAANGGAYYQLIDQSFYNYLSSNNNQYPGDNQGGEVIDTIHNMLNQFSGAQTLSSTRSVTLAQIDDFQGNYQFAGDGTAAHPPLYNREALGFFPYQVNANKFVIPMYIMTRDMSKVYNTGAPNTDPTRFDMPQEHYRLTINGVNGDNAASSLSVYDPLQNKSVPVTVFSHSATQLVVDVQLTDSPRMLTINDASQTCKTADINCDGRIDIFDLTLLLSSYAESGSSCITAPQYTCDLNGVGGVNVIDLSILLSRYGS